MFNKDVPSTSFDAYQLANGLQVVGCMVPDSELVAIAFCVRTGARDEERAELFGISHFLEHMMFKGTETLNTTQLAIAWEKLGATYNASTSSERTIYHTLVTADLFEQAFHLLCDQLYPRLLEDDFEAEKDVIINEIARSEEKPQGYAYRRMKRVYFQDHPLGNPVLGTRESIRALRLADMQQYWQQHYVANNITLIVAGNFDWDTCTALAKARCGGWHRGPIIHTSIPYEPTGAFHDVLVEPRLKQQTITLSMPSVSMKDQDYYAAMLGTSILGRGNGSRLYWNIRQRGLARSATSAISTFTDTGFLAIEANATPSQAPQVLQLLRKELSVLLEEGITEDELQRAKIRWISIDLFRTEHTYALMRSLLDRWTAHGRYISQEEEVQMIEQVTVEDVMRSLHRFPLRKKQVLTAYGPLSQEELLASE